MFCSFIVLKKEIIVVNLIEFENIKMQNMNFDGIQYHIEY